MQSHWSANSNNTIHVQFCELERKLRASSTENNNELEGSIHVKTNPSTKISNRKYMSIL